jgi:hypothetical protein
VLIDCVFERAWPVGHQQQYGFAKSYDVQRMAHVFYEEYGVRESQAL